MSNIEFHTDEELSAHFTGAVSAVVRTMMSECARRQICPACLAEAVHDAIVKFKKELPHLDDGETFEIRELHVHDAGNA